ncbi:MAG: pantetheine-phosphate adenylyltransferase [Streptococcaceae bacterium]|jgi:pantetheine-phosphate adenylyltransferase|nr:pantetheine-phosphate adenylyltransferase [Streptococcaceae bacterium]
MNERMALFPGSFDLLTNGHVDIIKRSAKLFDKLVVGIFTNTTKKPLFTSQEKKKIIENIVKPLEKVKVQIFEKKLTVDIAKKMKVYYIIRSIRNTRDYEYERNIARLNQEISQTVETVFLLADSSFEHLSSGTLKEIYLFGGDISSYVPKEVFSILDKKRRK